MMILLIYLFGFLVWLGLLWFDSLWQIPFFALLVGGLFHASYLAVRGFRRERKTVGTFFDFIPLYLVLLSFAVMFTELTDRKVQVDHLLFAKQRLDFIEKLRQRKNEAGTVKLPHWWLSDTGEAEILNPVADHFMVGFPVRRKNWIVVYTAVDTVSAAKKLVCSEVISVRKLSPHWYYLHID